MKPLTYEFDAPLTCGTATVATIRMAAEIVPHEAPINDFDRWSVGDVYAIGNLELGGTVRCPLNGLDSLYTLAMVTICRKSHVSTIDRLWAARTEAAS